LNLGDELQFLSSRPAFYLCFSPAHSKLTWVSFHPNQLHRPSRRSKPSPNAPVVFLKPLLRILRHSRIERSITALEHVAKPNLFCFCHGHSETAGALKLFHFLMRRVFPARVTEFLRLEPLRVLFAVLGGRVVPVFAIVALQCDDFSHGRSLDVRYSMISATAPDPTVWPPSRIANRNPFSSATGVISVISVDTLSPGITISTPVGSFTSPVTSVVRK
jgi:hypothetical protein